MDDNLYQPPGVEIEAFGENEFGRFDISKAFNLAWDGFQRNMGVSVATMMALVGAVIAAFFIVPIVGYFLVTPHLILLGAPLAGLYAVRGKLEVSNGFIGMRKFGRVLWAGLIWLAIIFIIGGIFSGPSYYAMLKDVNWNAEMKDIIAAIAQGSQQAPLWMTGVSYLGSVAAWYVAARLTIYLPLIVERDMNIADAFQATMSATSRDQGMLFLYVVITNIISGAGIILCGIGVLFSAAFGMVLQGAAIYLLFNEGKMETEPVDSRL